MRCAVDGGRGCGDIFPEVPPELRIAHEGHRTVRHGDAAVVTYSLVGRDAGRSVRGDVVVVVLLEGEDRIGDRVVARNRGYTDANRRIEGGTEDQRELVGQLDVDEGFVLAGVLVVIGRCNRQGVGVGRIHPVIAAGGRGITRVVRPSLGRVGQRGAGVGRADAAEQPVRRRPVVVGEVDSQGSFDRIDGVVQGPGSLNRSGTRSEVERTS